MKTVRYTRFIPFLFTALFTVLSGCDDFLVVEPPKDELSTQSIFASDAGAEAAMRGVYTDMANNGVSRRSGYSLSVLGGILADDFSVFFFTNLDGFLNNDILPDDATIEAAWNESYNIVYQLNLILNGLEASTSLSADVKSRLEAEAKFLRAFNYFYLVHLWGDVPLINSTDYLVTSSVVRTNRSQVYDQIRQDLIDAKNGLPEVFSSGIGERTRPTKWAASALLARHYLYMENWEQAEAESSLVINNTSLFRLNHNLDSCFLKNNLEAIWQAYPALPLPANTLDGYNFLPSDVGFAPYFYMTDDFLSFFESNDQRASKWLDEVTAYGLDFTFPSKYKVTYITNLSATDYKEYAVILRLAEQYLIRAEARVHLGNVMGENSAASDLNKIRNRAGLANKTPTTVEGFINAILNERRAEFFAEWGHRWFDLKRTGSASTVLASKPGWNEEDVLWPIPQRELDVNSKMTQNPGYY